jgi:hypothetical protein
VVRELGLERCKTVRSLSAVCLKRLNLVTLIRKECVIETSGIPVVISDADRLAKFENVTLLIRSRENLF